MKKIIAWYIVIGWIVGTYAWSIDPYRSRDTAWAIPFIAAIWPLWLFLYSVFS